MLKSSLRSSLGGSAARTSHRELSRVIDSECYGHIRSFMSLRIFTAAWKVFWLGTALLVSLVDIFPFDILHVRPTLFYSYEFIKAAAFVGLGFEIPLAFWRFNSLNRGLAISLVSAAGIAR